MDRPTISPVPGEPGKRYSTTATEADGTVVVVEVTPIGWHGNAIDGWLAEVDYSLPGGHVVHGALIDPDDITEI